MKKFTLFFTFFLMVTLTFGQNSRNLQFKIQHMQEKFSRYSALTAQFSKATHTFTHAVPTANALKNAVAVQTLDSVVYQDYDAQTPGWINTWKDSYQYDAEMNNTAWFEQEWDLAASSWQDYGRIELEYNGNGRVSEMIMYYADETSGELVLQNRATAFYNPEGRLDSIKHYFAEAEDTWTIEARQYYHYNEMNQLVQMDMISLEEDEQGTYLQTMKFVYEYNGEGNMETSSIYFIDDEMEVLFSQTEFTYDASGRRTVSEVSSLNFTTFQVELDSRTEFEYNEAGDVSAETIFLWDVASETWIGDQKYEYTYSDTSFSEVVFPSYLQFWGVNEETNTFNQVVTEINGYTLLAGNWEPSERTLFYYSEGSPTRAGDILQAQVSVYPNPASGKVKFTWTGYNLLSLEVYNITGAKVMEQQVASGTDVYVSSLKNGVYLYRLLNKAETLYSGKLIKK